VISVVICTARKTAETTYDAWLEVADKAFRREIKSPILNGEFLALLAATKAWRPVPHHIFYQLIMLALGTQLPNEVIIVDRCLVDEDADMLADLIDDMGLPFDVIWRQPLVFEQEMRDTPHLASLTATLPTQVGPTFPIRSRAHPYMAADKNSGIVYCRTDNLILLDDCCLPGMALVETAADACERGKILMLQHKQLYLARGEQKEIDYAEANTDLKLGHRVAGIFAMPVKYPLAINGYNTKLDGQRYRIDEEFLARLDIYAQNTDVVYETSPSAVVYEIQHDIPWKDRDGADGTIPVTTWRADGPNLVTIRDSLLEEWRSARRDEEDEDEGEE
jgi:gamma-glutamylcyclotransferase (GGCT)/AIG2-like uncharacterized protein YtfP